MILHARKYPITQHPPSTEPQTQQYPGQPLTSSRPRHEGLTWLHVAAASLRPAEARTTTGSGNTLRIETRILPSEMSLEPMYTQYKKKDNTNMSYSQQRRYTCDKLVNEEKIDKNATIQ